MAERLLEGAECPKLHAPLSYVGTCHDCPAFRGASMFRGVRNVLCNWNIVSQREPEKWTNTRSLWEKS